MNSTFVKIGLGVVLSFCLFFLAFKTGQNEFPKILLFYSGAFLAYFLLLRQDHNTKTLDLLMLLAVVSRLVIFFAWPGLSDDLYRFIWDGRLISNGINPFNELPSFYMEQGNEINGLSKELFQKLNSPNYFTIYPPVCQATFGISTWLFPHSEYASMLVMKTFLLVAELGILCLGPRLIESMGLPRERILIYALNPLVIIEVMGNLHFEGGMVFFLIAALYFLLEKKYFVSALCFALSVSTKLLPLMFLPLLIPYLKRELAMKYFLMLGGLLVLFFLPLLNADFLANIGSSLNLYFQKFEFNASVYYFFRFLGYQLLGYNLIAYIGPILAIGTFSSIIYISLKYNAKSLNGLAIGMLMAITIYLFFATTIHPWYVIMPLALSMFSKLHFVKIWSFLITLTYINYSYVPYHENLWIVTVEYLLVGAFVYIEWKRNRNVWKGSRAIPK